MGAIVFGFFFFFSSTRRHTRYWRDWSSHVCSSDLFVPTPAFLDHEFLRILEGQEYVMGMNQHSGAKQGQYLQVEAGNVATGGNQMTGVNEQHIVGAQTLRQAGKRQVFNRTLDVFVGAGPDLHP